MFVSMKSKAIGPTRAREGKYREAPKVPLSIPTLVAIPWPGITYRLGIRGRSKAPGTIPTKGWARGVPNRVPKWGPRR